MRMKAIMIGTLTSVFAVAGVAANEVEVDEGRRMIDAFLTDIVSISGRFEQQLVDADDIVVEKSSGQLDILRPGRFRWSYDEPYQQVIVADGLNIWSYDVDLEQVTVKPQDDALGSTPALLLGGTTEVLDEFDYIGSLSERGTLWVRLRPLDTESGFRMVELGFTNERLTRMLFTDNLEQTTLVALVEVTFNGPLDTSAFEFVPPDGVDVVGEALTPPEPAQ